MDIFLQDGYFRKNLKDFSLSKNSLRKEIANF